MSSKNRRFNIKNSLYFLLPFFILALAACSDQNSNNFSALTLTAEPASLPADGYSQSIIQAELAPVNGEEVRDRTKVRFTIVSGEGRIDSSSETRDGLAFARLTASPNPGTARIRAESNGNIAEITVNYENRNPAHIELADGFPEPSSVSLAGTGGQEISRVVFNVTDVHGEPVGDGYRIDFRIMGGPGGGEFVEPTSATTREGQVSTIFHSGNKSAPVSIRATYHDNGNISATSTQIATNAGPPVGEEFGISASHYNISGLYLANLQNAITVNVADVYGNSVSDGTAVSFKTYDTGGFFSPNIVDTLGGLASSTLHSGGSYAQPLNGFVSVTAETDGGNSTHVRAIAIDPGNSNIMYVGTSGGGVYKSTTAGSSWENVSRTFEHNNLGQNWIDPYVNDISINPDAPEMIYAATGYEGRGNIYRSLNGGMTWNSNNLAEWYGLERFNSAVLTVLCDNGSDYVWAGTKGHGLFISQDGISFSDSGILPGGSEKTIRAIAKASGTGNTSTLYAATPTGVYKTFNGGSTWARVTNFTGANITSVVVHPDNPNTIYAGTQEYGVWYSTNGGDSWRQYIDGLGKGLKATQPIADSGNAGSGLMSDVGISETTKTENWTVVYNGSEDNWVVTGTISGRQSASAITGESYTSDRNEVTFRIVQGSSPFEDGDAFRFKTYRDSGMNIKDLQVYHSVAESAYFLYAITYSFGAQEYHPVGNVYSLALNPGISYRPIGEWRKANRNLPEIDSSKTAVDNPLHAQHVMAVDNPRRANSLFVGGQGINLYKAVDGVKQGNPVWEESRSGLTNLIMARTPILFSGLSYMLVEEVSKTSIVIEVPVEGGEEGEVEQLFIGFDVIYKVYIEDRNGNPPIVGSSFTVEQEVAAGDNITLADVDYPDAMIFPGTWRDRNDPATDNPYIISTSVFPGDKLIFTFDPACGTASPGCSGTKQERVIPF